MLRCRLPFAPVSATRVTQIQEARITGRAVRDVVPGTLLVTLILSLYAVGVLSQFAHGRITGTPLPLRIRVVPEYRTLDLAL